MADKNASAAVPFQIGGFKIVRQVGEGSFGSVYLAKHQGTEGYVAIKAARRTVDKKAMATRNSLIEIEGAILQQLSHKNIVKVYKCFEEAGVKALVLEFLSGIDLCKLLPSGKPGLEEREAAIIVRYILEGLNYLHSLNIVHRDVKPSRLSSLGNILIPLSRDYTNLKLTDFGLSVSLSSLNKKALTADCGTTMYMSPERLLNKVYDTKADVFSVGVVMLEILNGRFSQEMLNRQKGHSQDFFRYYNWDRHCSDLPR
jgi:serine/threonine protein kinase